MSTKLYQINLNDFIAELRSAALESFVSAYTNSIEFMKRYHQVILSFDVVFDEVKDYIFIKDDKYIYDPDDYEIMVHKIYNLLVFKVMSKLVDDGYLELCWCPKKQDFIWRKTHSKLKINKSKT